MPRSREQGCRTRVCCTAMALAVATLLLPLSAAPAAPAQTLTVLHTFSGGGQDGGDPLAGVTMDAAGNLYGTTYGGGANGEGAVYKLAHKGSGWELSPLYNFAHGNGGYAPVAGITIGSDGNLYGTASKGGQFGAGTVYKLSPSPTVCKTVLCPWTETPLYQFTGGSDGGEPDAGLIFDSAGNLYGTTKSGGLAGVNGVVFELMPSGSGWTESVLHTFSIRPDGANPYSALTFDGNGNLYGTTLGGGTGFGTVYELMPSGSGWTEQVLYVFQGTNDGAYPYAGVVLDRDGNVYGAAEYEGAGGGTIYELTPSNGNWLFSVIYNPMEASLPFGTLARSSSGTLYGTFNMGGIPFSCGGEGCGAVFQLTPSNGGWVYTALYEFTGGADGGGPMGGLILDSSGNLYGTTAGLAFGPGSVFELAP